GIIIDAVLATSEKQSQAMWRLREAIVEKSNGNNHPPPTLLSLVRPILGSKEGNAEAVFYNGGDASLTFSWRFRSTSEISTWHEETLATHQSEKRIL
ncbi:MAG: hypothetical protein OXI63_19865, partial [Candidatus Poribacteria bacterium]|nr:hypothetical protein [Candidatus Poribacteria bacterium]